MRLVCAAAVIQSCVWSANTTSLTLQSRESSAWMIGRGNAEGAMGLSSVISNVVCPSMYSLIARSRPLQPGSAPIPPSPS